MRREPPVMPRQEIAGDGVGDADPHRARGGRPREARQPDGLVHRGQDVASVQEEAVAFRRQRHAARVALEQARAERGLQLLHRAR